MILGCCVVTLASHDSLTLFANSLVFIGFHLLLSGSQGIVLLKKDGGQRKTPITPFLPNGLTTGPTALHSSQ